MDGGRGASAVAALSLHQQDIGVQLEEMVLLIAEHERVSAENER